MAHSETRQASRDMAIRFLDLDRVNGRTDDVLYCTFFLIASSVIKINRPSYILIDHYWKSKTSLALVHMLVFFPVGADDCFLNFFFGHFSNSGTTNSVDSLFENVFYIQWHPVVSIAPHRPL